MEDGMIEVKDWYKSKVFWVNAITTVILILELFTAANGAAPLIPVQYLPWIGVVVAALNIVLRVWFVDGPVTKPLGIGAKKDGG
jgi:hypothetical protein